MGEDGTSERIRAEALRLFVERGFGTTTIEQISTAAEVGVATIYRRWPDKAAIANELYAVGIGALLDVLDERGEGDPRSEFRAIWRRFWDWASTNRDLFLLVSANTGAPWVSEVNAARKADLSRRERATYARLGIDADPDFAAVLVSATITSVLAVGSAVDPDDVAERLWRALLLTAP